MGYKPARPGTELGLLRTVNDVSKGRVMRGYRLVLLMLAMFLLVILAVFRMYEQQLSRLWFGLVANPELETVLTEAASAHRDLAKLEPARAAAARDRFDRLQTMRNHLRIVAHNRETLIGQFEKAVWTAFGLVLVIATAIHYWQRRQTASRLEALRSPLAALAAGDPQARIEDKRQDAIGMMGRMIEETAAMVSRQQARLRMLEQVSMWREAARRHAHELRSPLTALRSEVDRLAAEHGDLDGVAVSLTAIRDELRVLQRFVEAFTAFGRLPRPRLKPTDIRDLVERIVARYSEAWPHLDVDVGDGEALMADVDEDLFSRVLVNLADNADRALEKEGQGKGTLRIHLERAGETALITIRDNGPGVPESLKQRLFAPYVTTRPVGKGMGLGLAISRAILLDHGGDLMLEENNAGASFRLEFPLRTREAVA